METIDYSKRIKTFDVEKEMNNIKNFSAIICSKRRAGKSILLRDILSKIKNNYDRSYVFSNTAHLQPDLFDYIPEANNFYGLQTDILDKIYAKQEDYILKEIKKGKDKKKLKHILLIFDDIISDRRIRTSQTFDKLFIESRHINICVILLTQYLSSKHGPNVLARRNVDFFFSFYPSSEGDKDLLVKEYLSVKSVKEGKKLLGDITLDHYNAVCIANYKVAREYEDYVYRYQAAMELRKFYIGEEDYLDIDSELRVNNIEEKEVPNISGVSIGISYDQKRGKEFSIRVRTENQKMTMD
jgi:hypothetical protein